MEDTLENSEQDTGPTRHLFGGPVGDRCVTCDGPLASDQRYCLNCGERRGKSGFAAAAIGAQPQPTAPASAAPAAKRHRLRWSSGATMVTGIATLLLAMGVGVLIGRTDSGNATTQRASAPPVQVVTVAGSGGAASSGGTSTKKSKKKTTQSKAKTKTVTVHLSKKVAAKANAAAAKVLGSSGKNLAPITVQPGQKCAHGAGCQGGKFTGHFFGG